MKSHRIYLFFVATFFSLSTFCFAQTATAPQEKTLSIAGLKEKVTVRRDERGIPYIEAASEADLNFAQGYVMASDRLWQMDLYRRVASGETAEIFGRGTLEEDKRWRKFGFSKISADALSLISPEVRAALEDYARGVNAYIATLDEKTLPVEFQILQYRPRQWQAADSIIIGKILTDGLSSSWRQDLLKAMLPADDKRAEMFEPSSNYDVLLFGKDTGKLRVERGKSRVGSWELRVKEKESKAVRKNSESGMQSQNKISDPQLSTLNSQPSTPNSQPSTLNSQLFSALTEAENIRKSSLERIGLYAEDLAASNNWVVSGKRTADGQALLSNDPHLQVAQPPIWYLVNLSAPNLKVAGVTIVGAPGVVLGHNENIAWGATNVGPDVQDLYLEEFDPGDPLRYKTPAGWETAQTRREEIKVRKNPLSPETETVTLDVVTTRHGVIFFENSGKRYALKWTALDPKNSELDSFYFGNRAKNWTEFKAALKRYGGAMQNFVYADTKGNIGWYAAGRVPIRSSGDGSTPYNGATGEGAWTGFIPFEELPNLYNPPEGFIVTANQRTVGRSYKYHDLIARIFVPFRAARLHQLLAGNSKLTVKDMRDFQYDTFSILNSYLAKEIVAQKGASAETIKLFSEWDGRMAPDSKAALVANEIRNVFRNKILEANFGAEQAKNIGWANEGNFLEKLIREKPPKWLPKEFSSYPDFFRACDEQARKNLVQRYGADETKWTWGQAGKINFPHPLAIAPLIGAQFFIPPLPLKGTASAGASPNVGGSVSMRFVATPGNWDTTLHGIPTGESGDPKSSHWKDQLDSWYTGNTPVFPFSKTAVEKATKEVWVLQPK